MAHRAGLSGVSTVPEGNDHTTVLGRANTSRTSGSKCSSDSTGPSGSNATWSQSSVNCSHNANHGSSRNCSRRSVGRAKWA